MKALCVDVCMCSSLCVKGVRMFKRDVCSRLCVREVCHAKRRWMSPSAMPATQKDGRCRQVPRLPRQVPRLPRKVPRAPRAKKRVPTAPPEPAQCHKFHACQAERRLMSLCVKDGVRQRGGGGGGGGGMEAGRIQNQKQEPHTKMWGKNTKSTAQMETEKMQRKHQDTHTHLCMRIHITYAHVCRIM